MRLYSRVKSGRGNTPIRSAAFKACILLSAGFTFLAVPGESYARPSVEEATASFTDGRISLRVAPERIGSVLTFRDSDGKPKFIVLEYNLQSDIKFYRAANGKVVITGNEDGKVVYAIYIFDEISGSIIDEFMSFVNVAVSPNGRFVLFTKMFVLNPGAGSDVDQNEYVMLYDTSRPPGENRRESHGRDLFDQGVQVYPALARERKFISAGMKVGHTIQWGYFWSPDSTKAAFFDDQFPGDPISLGAHNEGNVVSSHRVPHRPALSLVLLDFSTPMPVARKLDTTSRPDSDQLVTQEPKITFGPNGIVVDTRPFHEDQHAMHVAFDYADER